MQTFSVTDTRGNCKTWTLDSGLDRGLDWTMDWTRDDHYRFPQGTWGCKSILLVGDRAGMIKNHFDCTAGTCFKRFVMQACAIYAYLIPDSEWVRQHTYTAMSLWVACFIAQWNSCFVSPCALASSCHLKLHIAKGSWKTLSAMIITVTWRWQLMTCAMDNTPKVPCAKPDNILNIGCLLDCFLADFKSWSQQPDGWNRSLLNISINYSALTVFWQPMALCNLRWQSCACDSHKYEAWCRLTLQTSWTSCQLYCSPYTP